MAREFTHYEDSVVPLEPDYPDDIIADFDESLLGTPGYNSNLGNNRLIFTHPPKPASPASLYEKLCNELNFSDGPGLLSAMEKWNEDLFSCLPRFTELYAENVLLSTSVDEVIGDLENPRKTEMICDLQVHGSEPFPEVPMVDDDLEDYITAIQGFFIAELRAREVQYSILLTEYCRAILRYLYAGARRGPRDKGKGVTDESLRQRLRATIRNRYYKEVATIARVLYLHLYISVVREVSWKLHASQVVSQSLFVSLSYTWIHRRQLECIFHPILFNHGVVMLEDRPLTFRELQTINYRRHALGLPLIRAGLIEEEGQPLLLKPEFSGSLPRTIGFLTQHIRAKMEAFSDRHPTLPRFPHLEHSYAKQEHPINYGTTTEAMMDPPSPSAVLPGDPDPKIGVKIQNTTQSLQLPSHVTLDHLESKGYVISAQGLSYDDIPEHELNKMFHL
ncbi:transactivating tegument protein VP16 [Felid alphaherpesvirus 1]|nr:transactivating tegument protein VP16 [Felid alphaherpesvirus 1]AVW80390.1 transactivating tegument protein VP16 [Felid alphaherpesvirus 1]AVW80621.1 transactivating tegument protein VP16 [Felid alphaherpesvirus 1]AVW80775.1 transactivating tegument protein VP16 [Felid alphaherpesvirus 1]AVW81237.1 transactivating tegument protein VP16 [Felid alphaherpesvirus 1]